MIVLKNINYTLYLVTDRDLLWGEDLAKEVEKAIIGGVTIVQLREKHLESLEFYNIAQEIKTITDKHNIPLIINDRLDIALAVDAAGLHIGQSDLPAAVARKVLGKNKLLGVSAANVEESLKAERDGADYLGIGAMFPTNTKGDARAVTLQQLKEIKEKVNIPVVAIGGITEENAASLKPLGIEGIAVVSAIISKEDKEKAAENLRRIFR